MRDLIYRDDQTDRLRALLQVQGEVTLDYVKDALRSIPSVDAVEVVRCRDCTFYQPIDETYKYRDRVAKFCVFGHRFCGENNYCSDGIRRDVY